MLASSNLVQLIKEIAMGAVKASKPCDYQIGTVVSEKPLKIKMSQSLILEEEFIHLSRGVADFKAEITLDGIKTRQEADAAQDVTVYADRQEVEIHNSLKKGEKVLMFRKNGGRDFIVIDRVVG